MSKKKTAIDRAIEAIEADIAGLLANYEAQRNALQTAIGKLRDQKSRVPARRKRTVAVSAAPLPLDGGGR